MSERKNLYKKKCLECYGVGLLKNNSKILNCECDKSKNKKKCFYCENTFRYGSLEKCDLCDGYGEVFYCIETNTQYYLSGLEQYKIVENNT